MPKNDISSYEYHLLSQNECKALFAVASSCIVEISTELYEFLDGKKSRISLDEIPSGTLREEFKTFVDKGTFHPWNVEALDREEEKRKDSASPFDGVRAVNVNLTPRCKLDCVYCYAGGGDYGCDYNEMSVDEALRALELLEDQGDDPYPRRIELFGGEPLLAVSVIEPLAKEAQSRGVRLRISTSFTEVDDRVIDLLGQYDVTVSISLDGPASVQDRQRPYVDGRPTYGEILSNLERLKSRYPDVTTVARMTWLSPLPPVESSIQHFVDTGLFNFASLYLAQIPEEHDDGTRVRAGDKTFRAGISALTKSYAGYFKGPFRGILEVERMAQLAYKGLVPKAHCGAGRHYVTVSPDGTVHPCHRLCGDTESAIGSTTKGVVGERAPWHRSWWSSGPCSKCWARFLCAGGCRQEGLVASGKFDGLRPEGCAYSRGLAKIALSSLMNETPAMVKAREQTFQELESLFVFCGQRALITGRSK